MRPIARLSILAGLATSIGATPILADDVLPITQITLYRSGVGYFMHRGLVDGNEEVSLRFDAAQINDILKSMMLLDLSGGEIDAVSYASKEPLERRLGSFAIDISDSPDLATLLGRIRGARVALETLNGRVEGTVLGVEERAKPLGQETLPVPYVNLVTSKGLRSVDLTDASSLEILDEQLATELGKALAALAEHRADTVKSVDLSFRGEGARQVVVTYVHEMPVWKTSYRLILPEDSVGAQGTVQGWAIVENTTDEDWKGVELSLVAGQPVGFTMDLYQPLYVPRPEIPVPVLAGLMPVVYEEDVFAGERFQMRAKSVEAAPRPDAARDRSVGRRGVAGSAAEGAWASTPGQMDLSSDDFARYAAASQASAGQIGEVFQYTIDHPVTVERQTSAMIPILSGAIEARRVSIYNRMALADHPMRGVEVTNTSGLQLMPGPVSVLDGSAYAGDAQIGHVSEGEKRLLSYAVDLEVDARTEDRNAQTVQSIKIERGNLIRTVRTEMGTVYTLSNKDADGARTVLIEHEKNEGWTLIEPKDPSETTQNLYRVEVALAPGQSKQQSVLFERVDRQSVGLTSVDVNELLVYSRQGRVSQAVIDAVREAMRLNNAVRDVDQRIGALQRELQEIGTDQSRIRDNMAAVDQSSALYRRYVTKLDEQETRLEQIRQEQEAARTQRDERQAELNRYLAALNVE